MLFIPEHIPFEKLEKILFESINYLNTHINNDGSFIYELNPETSTVYPNYNILRHAGTIYSMYSTLDLNKTDFGTKKNADKGFYYLISFIKTHKTNATTYKFVEYNNQIKLGGTALTLLAIIERNKRNIHKIDHQLMIEMANFIVWMQDSTGYFYSKYSIREKQFLPFDSFYYSSQAILSLVRLYKIDNNYKWLNSAILAADYLIEIRDKNISNNNNFNDHWLIIALGELFEIEQNEKYKTHINIITNRIIQTNPVSDTCSSRYFHNFSVGQIATRAEGIAATILLELKLKNEEKYFELLRELENILSFSFYFQYTCINNGGLKDHKNFTGGFRTSIKNPNIRIDNIQHIISAILNLMKIYNYQF